MPYKNPDKKRQFQREWIAARRALWFQDKCCRNCGCKDGLELDHIDPSEKASHKIWSWSWDRIMKEAAKCQVLCISCHQEKTESDVRKMREEAHGTIEGFKKWRCRCSKCTIFAEHKHEIPYGVNIDNLATV